jgi:hypothetical protein|tara:strand:+ start:2984 stop:3211 length:228 start_codon:yes stop_codon:yes gene_type:complete
MKIDRRALKESLSDVGVGIIISLPLSFGILNVCTYFELPNIAISSIQVAVFTVVAIIRKYCVRVIFKKGDMNGAT